MCVCVCVCVCAGVKGKWEGGKEGGRVGIPYTPYIACVCARFLLIIYPFAWRQRKITDKAVLVKFIYQGSQLYACHTYVRTYMHVYALR